MLNAFTLYGEFTDAGYRFRPNLYDRVSKWYWPFGESSTFYDLTFFNHHTFRINEENIKTTTIAEIFFRIDTNLLEHQKQVTGFTDFMDSLAGMMGFLFELLTAMVGSFIFWQQITNRCFDLYTEETDPLRETPLFKSGFGFYLRNYSAISCLFSSSEENTKQVEELESMQERMGEELDQMEVIKTIWDLRKHLDKDKSQKGTDTKPRSPVANQLVGRNQNDDQT